jgi:beta-glucosidase
MNVSSVRRSATEQPFLFATGIENSAPVVTGPGGRALRRDQMTETGHDERWAEDFQLARDLGLRYIRYGVPYYRVHLGPGRYDWDFSDITFNRLRELGLTPIADLCHFGVPDWIGDFQNSEWPELFAEYARAFAGRYPWIQLYTAVNEIFVCARFSARLGWWNERLASDQAFVRALRNLVRANLRAEEEILTVQQHALFVQSESTEHFHAKNPAALGRAHRLNQIRFLSLDLSYGNDVSAFALRFLMDAGLSKEDYDWFMLHGSRMKPYCVMGNDYYDTNEHTVPHDGRPLEPAGEIFGYYIITRQYYNRYRLPVMHTETNVKDAARAPAWLWKEWLQMLRLKEDGVPIIGFTWYSLIDQMDWDSALREVNHRVDPCGLFDLDRRPRPVAQTYRRVIEEWRDILPMESHHVSLRHEAAPQPAPAPPHDVDLPRAPAPDKTVPRHEKHAPAMHNRPDDGWAD